MIARQLGHERHSLRKWWVVGGRGEELVPSARPAIEQVKPVAHVRDDPVDVDDDEGEARFGQLW